jgi:aspartate/methionine/tyrosine aminotransferase
VDSHFDDGFRLTPDALERALASHTQFADAYPVLVILNYPSNPTGATFGAKELEQVAAVAARYGAIVLSDEIYGRLTYADTARRTAPLPSGRPSCSREHRSIAEFYPEGTIILDGASKWAGAGGWRVGAFVFPETMTWLHRTLVSAASETYSSVCAPVQYAAVAAFDGSADEYIAEYLDSANRVLHLVSSFVATHLRASGAHVRDSEGGFYVFPDFSGCRGVHDTAAKRFSESTGRLPEFMTSQWLCKDIIQETGVAILPGSAFGRAPQELTARIAFVDFDGASAQNAVGENGDFKFLNPNYSFGDTIQEAFLQKHCPSVWWGVHQLAAYLT